MSKFKYELKEMINRNSLENTSDTPDFILAEFLTECLGAWDRAFAKRKDWYSNRSTEAEDEVAV